MNQVGILVGSLRQGSYTRQIATYAAGLFPANFQVSLIDISQLPLYNPDLDGDHAPIEWQAFRQAVGQMDAVAFFTPEYNRSIPGGLKNALDVGSVPHDASVWDGKPALVVSVTPGAIGGFGANHALRQVLVTLNMPVLQQPEAYIGNVAQLLDHDGQVTDTRTAGYLQTIVDHFVDMVRLQRLSDPLLQLLHQGQVVEDAPGLQCTSEPGRCYLNDAAGRLAAEGDYDVHDNVMTIQRVFVDEDHRGQGLAGKMMTALIDYATTHHHPIIAECPYAKAYFEKHPELQGLLAQV